MSKPLIADADLRLKRGLGKTVDRQERLRCLTLLLGKSMGETIEVIDAKY